MRKQFTFQSGDIQMKVIQGVNDTSIAFTFQSGDIRIELMLDDVTNVLIFTFQSGDIQIYLSNLYILLVVDIYIPIW